SRRIAPPSSLTNRKPRLPLIFATVSSDLGYRELSLSCFSCSMRSMARWRNFRSPGAHPCILLCATTALAFHAFMYGAGGRLLQTSCQSGRQDLNLRSGGSRPPGHSRLAHVLSLAPCESHKRYQAQPPVVQRGGCWSRTSYFGFSDRRFPVCTL